MRSQKLRGLTSYLLAMFTCVSTSASALEYSASLVSPVSCNNTTLLSNYCQPNQQYTLSLNSKPINDDKDINSIPPRYLTISDGKDWDYLLGQTYTFFGLSLAAVGLMTLLPEGVTHWDSDQRSFDSLGQKWKDNVSQGPVWDNDSFYLNYIMHPYFGGVYYTVARHSGFNGFESFLYSFTMSTFFWEYGVEAFAEVPSWQDIIVTPILGSLVGEGMYQAEQYIAFENDGELLGSETVGTISLFLLNPIGHIHYWFTGDDESNSELSLTSDPSLSYPKTNLLNHNTSHYAGNEFIGMTFKYHF
nr:DUF3943 domain-containing protein [Vibrio algicola]